MKFSLLRFTNSAIMASVIILTLTGVYGLFWVLPGILFDIHRFAGWVLLALIPWKTGIALASLRRGWQPNFRRGLMTGVSLLLAALAVSVLILGLAWHWRLGPEDLWLRQTAISWHWMLALGLLVPFILHVWVRWPRPRRADFISRRSFLKALGLGVVSLAGWWAAAAFANEREASDGPRRFTGSRLDGLYSGNDFPVTHSIAVQEGAIDLAAWRLRVTGAVEKPLSLSLADLDGLPLEERSAALDCTLGWYTLQRWGGVRLTEILARAGISPSATALRLVSVSGYAHLFTLSEAESILLARFVSGEPLAHWHGAPLRAVVPGRRGWFWVKWLERIEVL